MAEDSTGKAAVPDSPASNTASSSATDVAGKRELTEMVRLRLERSGTSFASLPPPGSILTGKQEHYLKRELIALQSQYEVSELASPTALQRFGAPFRSEKGEVSPEDSELPLLRYIFVHHVRNFPFLDKAKEKEFWQDKLQQFLESFANKNISTSKDRLEETKRKKLAIKAEKLIELMMVSGIPTASGYEERIRFSEIEVVDRGANEQGLVANAPQGHEIHGWDVNIAGVRTTSVKQHVRYHQRAQYLIRVKEAGKPEIYVGRRYDEFKKMHKRLRMELPGKVLPPLPRPNESDQLISFDDDSDSASSMNDAKDGSEAVHSPDSASYSLGNLKGYLLFSGTGGNQKREGSAVSQRTPRASADFARSYVLYREQSRVSLRAALRNLLQTDRIAQSSSMKEFLTHEPILLNEEELMDIERRRELDEKRIEEQRQFYEVARARAAELDIHMEKFRREIVESNGLTQLFQEIKEKNTIAELRPEYKKFAEWLKIEIAATIYHLFLAEDNSPELFSQARRIHSLVPYQILKNIVRFTNPAGVMAQVLDLFMAQPFGARSLLQRIFGMAIHDGISNIQKSIDILGSQKIQDPVLVDKIKHYTEADESIKDIVKEEAESEQTDLLVSILRSELFGPELSTAQIGSIFNAYVAWNNAVENVDTEMRQGAELFAHLKQLLKLFMRQRDKAMMLQMIEEPTTLKLFRDLFQIFYEPLVRVYKSANVYNSIIDFANFVDDIIKTVEAAQRQDFSADPNRTVQAFIDLCGRHEDNLYKFIHEVHIHDNGLFDQLMGWLEGILSFLKQGPRGGKLDMNDLFLQALNLGIIDDRAAIREINALIKWQMARKRWHQDKTRQKMAAEGSGEEMASAMPGLVNTFKSSDFGLDEDDLADLDDDSSFDSRESEFDDEADPIMAEQKRRAKQQERLRRSAGEPQKPPVQELHKLTPMFLERLRAVLA